MTLVRPRLTTIIAALLIPLTGCAGGTVDVADAPRFCELTASIDEIFVSANDARLSTPVQRTIRARVEELGAMVAHDMRDDFLLRYWPNTEPLPADLDTSGVRSQQAWDSWQDFTDRTCR